MSELSPNFRLRGVQDDHKGLQVAMPLVSVHDDDLTCIGSSFLVWPGVAITAAHVVREWLDYQEKRDGYKRAGVAFSVSAYQFFRGEILRWDVETIHSLWTADIAFLQFKMPSWWGTGKDQVIPPHARLNMNPPTPGEMVRVFGFPKSSIENGILHVSPSESVARVREVMMCRKVAKSHL